MKTKTIISIVIITIACITIFSLQAQETNPVKTISGIVTDSLGEPLPGTAIIVKGTNIRTLTNLDGKYSIDVPPNAILQFSFIGMIRQEIAVDNQQSINVVMEDEGFPIAHSTGLQPAQPINLTASQRENAKIGNSFAFQMFGEVSRQEGNNTFFSPLSLNMALAMLYNGTSGNTRAEMAKALGVSHLTDIEINEYYRKIMQALLGADPSTDITIANSVWYHNDFSVKDSFVDINKNYFDAKVQALDFHYPAAVDIINKWVAEKTNNRIRGIVNELGLQEEMIVLINALYFKGKWENSIRFNKANTQLDDFTKPDGQKVRAYMMEQTNWFPYYANEYLQSIEMNYGNRAFSMVIILPSEDMTINQLMAHLDNEKWQNIVDNMQRQRVWLKLPRFRKENAFQLNQPIRNVGMQRIFTDFNDFANISNDELALSSIMQKTFVEVNEEGTEAAAVTGMVVVGFGRVGAPPPPIPFFANRPFLYFIKERSTGVILFMGRMDNPDV